MVIAAIALISMGVFFLTAGTIGFLRFPDFYSRMHATGKCDTLGVVLSLTGLALYNLHYGLSLASILVSIKIIFIAVFWFLANPTATHALSRSAFESEVTPWTKDGRPVIEWPPK
ncbi:MAG: sodium:proton antiporter [Syntrophobacteraceae bacterium CG23_combo_of_CG06-09_8_20_14_all_50_8]|nr:MAG: sodium:proton antiporter [Syntrophobacteraceae bacterium CG23_combo_of_CG06-09_8_20_14_all_50_8]